MGVDTAIDAVSKGSKSKGVISGLQKVFSRLGFYVLIALIITGGGRIVTETKLETEGQPIPLKIVNLGKNVMFSTVGYLVGFDGNIEGWDNLIQRDQWCSLDSAGAEVCTKLTRTKKSWLLFRILAQSSLFLFVFIGLTIPILGWRLGIADMVQWITGSATPPPSALFIALLIIGFGIGYYNLFISANSAIALIGAGDIAGAETVLEAGKGYIPFQGIIKLGANFWRNPGLYVP